MCVVVNPTVNNRNKDGNTSTKIIQVIVLSLWEFVFGLHEEKSSKTQ